MKILFITPSYKPAYIYGGAMVVVYLLAEALAQSGHDVTVYTTTANGKQELEITVDKEHLISGVKVHYFKRITKDHSHISLGLWKKIAADASKFDVVHLHSWWSPFIVMAAALCVAKGIKPVLSPHGMFCDYVLNTNNKGKKQLLHSVIGKSLLRNTFLHVSTPMEWTESQKVLNGNWPGIIIPNLVELNNASKPPKPINQPFTIGFISRIDPKKGLDILLKALAKVNFDYKLQIAGTGEPGYVDSLKELALNLGIQERIEWLGWKDNVQKFNFYTQIDLFALTSQNENFAVVVIEALSVGTPVLLSKHVGLSDYVQGKELGWITEIATPAQVAAQLELAHISSDKRKTINNIAPAIIATDFNKISLAQQYASFYSNIVDKQLSLKN